MRPSRTRRSANDWEESLKYLQTAQAAQSDTGTKPISSPLTVFLNGAGIRCRPEIQKRHLNVVVGKIENRNISRRFGLVQQAAKFPARQFPNDLMAQWWDDQSKVIVISDGEPALPNLVRRYIKGPVTHILDRWHISTRVKHIENAVKGFLQTKGFSGLPKLFERLSETQRWNLWHGKLMTATTNLKVLIIDCDCLGSGTEEQRAAAARVIARCAEHYTYLSNNFDALTNYGRRQRNGLAISSCRAEGCVGDIGNTRMGKRRRVRWSPKGAHRVAGTKAAVLDGRLSVSQLAACLPRFAHSLSPDDDLARHLSVTFPIGMLVGQYGVGRRRLNIADAIGRTCSDCVLARCRI